jgi:uncharacterized RDD family membrane protein YckC
MSNSTYIINDKLLASNGSRFLNNFIDSLFTYVFSLVLQYCLFPFIIGIFNSFDSSGFGIWYYSLNEWYWVGIGMAITLGYYLLTEGLFGRSVAKFITGTIVIDKTGMKPSFRAIFKRTLCRYIPFEALSFLGNTGKGWHDTISDTYVVDKKLLDESVKLYQEFELIGVKEID